MSRNIKAQHDGAEGQVLLFGRFKGGCKHPPKVLSVVRLAWKISLENRPGKSDFGLTFTPVKEQLFSTCGISEAAPSGGGEGPELKGRTC